eukprot:TRINITY_DN14861_c0_g1_i2.p2 TRINITY_DN14861_c0_g1~~TRINITY_DN14861_c0_g1_i2.p2  ORF type:complete len:110 (+),score=37.49 TRINITY_DN14861_c0_g1_i2:98-427(+)
MCIRDREAREQCMAEEQPGAQPEEHRTHVSQVRALLNSRLRVRISDGRVIYGTLLCLDEHSNLILDRAEEQRDCLLYTSDAADEEDSGDLGGRRIIKKKKKKMNNEYTE